MGHSSQDATFQTLNIQVFVYWTDEVSFKDVQDLKTASKKRSFAKIEKSCELARSNDLDYMWVDTGCINKESSAELTEAINSMFRWYKSADVCYTFLSDIDISASDEATIEHQMVKSVWFERGWTLQELLAPENLVFFDQQWRLVGTKKDLSEILMRRTGIGKQALHGRPLDTYSIAQRMSWASRRVTTRTEDIAYCLLGIFDVNMPILYGEGTRAFLRLQEQIIKRSDDHTIFAWPIDDREQTGLLAESPAAFANCQDIRAVTQKKGHPPFSMTNRGLSCKLLARPHAVDTYLARLDCTHENLSEGRSINADRLYLGIFLQTLSEDDQYARVRFQG
ncbi:MAG: hypothetical protein Q9223_000741 [Gallowayella weberi]